MKVKVIERFNDKNTKEFYKLNQEIQVSKERYKEIKKYVEVIEDDNAFEEIVKKSHRRKGEDIAKS